MKIGPKTKPTRLETMRNLHSLRLQLFSRTLFTIGLVTLLMIDALALQNNNEADSTKEITTTMMMNNSTTHGKEHEDGIRHGDLSYAASKRKVPRGSDPIHNRRAGKSRRPPGRA
ncbi:hypothetical protein Bca4012_057463 [Brassica carinata]|uniref:Uncharacterized protein n=1 Tax=Brassica carinata TaxID=52824 RepID=A0A8X7W316_BRACI|nr:hypothetical protein Bca52824_014773 [Brassica carinata]